MPVLRIPCPKCHKTLQLPDRRLLGRRGKCAACGHSFVLKEPESARPPAADAIRHPATETVAAEPADFLLDLKRKRDQRRRQAVIIGSVTGIVVVGAIVTLYWQLASRPVATTAARQIEQPATSPAVSSLAAAVDAKPLSAAVLESNAELAARVRPTQGDPIDLRMLPSGVNLVMHLRPAELWSDDPAFRELRGSLTQTVTDWVQSQLLATCRRTPDQIEEALIGVLLGPTGSTPEIAAVVRLTQPARLSDLVEEFRGEPVRPDSSLRLFRSDTVACFIRDEQTFAVCPADLAEDLADWVETPNYNTTDGILQLLRQTDRDRLFTVVFEVEDVRRHEDWLFPADARPAFRRVLNVLGDECETACWSIHLNEELHSELLVRTRVAGADDILGPRRLAETLSARITDAPHRLLSGVRQLDPRHSGARRLIGRLPAMIESVRRATVVTTGDRLVEFTTLLPAKAAPNLALATLLTWNESLGDPGASVAPSRGVSRAPSLPQTIAERLQLPVDAEFRRSPLHEAFAYLCSEIDAKLEIDGDALKDAGYTQNMPQTFNIGVVPVEVAISRIVGQYDGDGKDELQMVVIVNETTKTLHVTTRKFADQQELTPLDLPSPPE